VTHTVQHMTAARYHLMKLASAGRDDGRPAFVRAVEAELIEDRESVMLSCFFVNCSFSEPDDNDASNVVGLFFDLEREEIFDAKAVEAGFSEVVELMNSGFRVR
jgi:hypothetical protein